MRLLYRKSGFIIILLSLSLINISNGIAQEDNDFMDNSPNGILENSNTGQSGLITNSANQTASPSISTSNQSDIKSILDNPRMGSLNEDFNPDRLTKSSNIGNLR